MKAMAYIFWTVWVAPLIPLFFGIGMGPSKEEKAAQAGMANLQDFSNITGQKDTSQASDFWSTILSGDMGKIMKVLGPQINAIKGQGQQQIQTAAQFGNRSGGTNAYMQTAGVNTRQMIDNLIGQLTGSAAQNLGDLGSRLLNTSAYSGAEAFNQAKTIQQQKAAKWGDIFKSITSIGSAFLPGGGISSLFSGGGATNIATSAGVAGPPPLLGGSAGSEGDWLSRIHI